MIVLSHPPVPFRGFFGQSSRLTLLEGKEMRPGCPAQITLFSHILVWESGAAAGLRLSRSRILPSLTVVLHFLAMGAVASALHLHKWKQKIVLLNQNTPWRGNSSLYEILCYNYSFNVTVYFSMLHLECNLYFIFVAIYIQIEIPKNKSLEDRIVRVGDLLWRRNLNSNCTCFWQHLFLGSLKG